MPRLVYLDESKTKTSGNPSNHVFFRHSALNQGYFTNNIGLIP